MANCTVRTEEAGILRHPANGQTHAAGSTRDDRGAPVIFEALSDDGPFHRLTDEEARRHVTFAFFYYAGLAAIVITAMVWR